MAMFNDALKEHFVLRHKGFVTVQRSLKGNFERSKKRA